MRESLRTELVVVIVIAHVFVTFQQTCGCVPAVVHCIVLIVAVVVRRADSRFPSLTGRVLRIVIFCFCFEMGVLVVHPVTIAAVDGFRVAAPPGSPVGIAAVL